MSTERHPDNVAASLFGGFVGTYLNELKPEDVARKEIPLSEVLPAPAGGLDTGKRPPEPPIGIGHYRKFQWAKEIKAIAIIPDFVVPTANARSVLPTSYSRADVVSFSGPSFRTWRTGFIKEMYHGTNWPRQSGLQPPTHCFAPCRPGQFPPGPGYDLSGYARQGSPALSPDSYSGSDGDSSVNESTYPTWSLGNMPFRRGSNYFGSSNRQFRGDRRSYHCSLCFQ